MPTAKKNTQSHAQPKKSKQSLPPHPQPNGAGHTAPSTSASKLKGTKKVKPAKRAIIYPEVTCQLCMGADALKASQARTLLGWQEESENIKFDKDNPYLFKDVHKNKVRCNNNNQNRPFYISLARLWQSEILHKNWELNGETLIIGETGLCIDSQHRLVGLVWAAQEWALHPSKWREYWPTEPTLESVVVYGIKETRKVINTINTGKSRSLMDAIYQSGIFGPNLRQHDVKQLSRIADHAVRLLWHRTGAGMDAFAPKRTHAESLDFIERHPKLLECVKHIYEENGTKNRIGTWLSPGYSAALLYLMGCAGTDRDKDDKTGYSNVPHPSEAQLDWGLWDSACEYWVLIAGCATSLKPVHQTIIETVKEGGGNMAERCAILIKGWLPWHQGKKVTEAALALEYKENDDGEPVLAETPTLGGIDIGNP